MQEGGVVRGIRAVALALGVAGTLLLTGCGEDEQLSKAQLIAKGDALCEQLDAKIDPKYDAIFVDFPDADMAKAKAEFPEIIEAFDEFEGDIADLQGPEADKKAIDAIKADNKKIEGVLHKAGAAAERSDEAAFKKALFDASPLFDSSQERSRAYGFKICGAEDDQDEGEAGSRLLRFARRLGSPSESAPALSPEQEAFIDQADALCKQNSDQIEPKLGPVFAGDLEKAALAIPEILLLGRDLVAKLRELPPPNGDEARVKNLIDTLEQAVTRFESLLQPAEAKDKAAYDAEFKQVWDSFGASEKAFAEYGFEECGH